MDPQLSQDLCQQSQQTPLLIFAWTLLGAAILATALRLYSKSKTIDGVTADDYLALASTIFAAAAVAILTAWIYAGLGRHVLCLDDPQFTLLWSLLAQMVNIIGICLIKVSVCICLLHVLDHELRLFRSSIWTLAIFLTASHIAHIVLIFLQCRPLYAVWYATVEGAKCFTHQQLSLVYYIGYGVGALTDFLCASLPIVVICRLHLNDRSRMALCVLIGFGTLIAGCAVAKTITMSGAWSSDFTWNSAVPTWFTIGEHYGAILVASISNLSGLLAPNAKSNPALYGVEPRARDGSLRSMPRKGSTWTLATPRLPKPTMAKKHFSISTFGLSEGEQGSRLTLVDNRFTVVEGDDDRLTCVAEEADDDHDTATLNSRSARTATLKSSQGGWTQGAIIDFGMLGKENTFRNESKLQQQSESRGHSLYSIGRLTRPSTPKSNTPKRLTISTRPTTPRSASRPSSRPGTPRSPGFSRMRGTLRMPGTPKRSVRTSMASSIYSDPPVSAGLATIPSPPVSARILPDISYMTSRPTTPKMPAWTTSPSGFTTPEGSRTPRSRTPAGSGSRTPNETSTPRGSRPGTPKCSVSMAVPVSKFRAEISDEVIAEAIKAGNNSNLELERGRTLPQPPQEVRVVDIPSIMRFDPHDATY